MFGICKKSNGPFPVVILGFTHEERESFFEGKELKGEIIKFSEEKSVIEPVTVKRRTEANQARVTWIVGKNPEVIFRIDDTVPDAVESFEERKDFYQIQPEERLYQIYVALGDSHRYYREHFEELRRNSNTFVSAT